MAENKSLSRLALWSIIIAIIVMWIKFLAWYLSGSVALWSDALESIVNVVAAIVAFIAISIAQRPADADHQFGHHKAEYFSAVIEGILIVVAALLIFNEAISALRHGYALDMPGSGMAVNAVATLINGIWAYVLITAGKKARSPALSADGRHILADVVTSVGVLFGLGVALLTGWAILDPIMAIIVGLNVLWEGWKLVSSSVDGLMDKAADSEDSALIEATIIKNATGALQVHDIKTRIAGPVHFIEFHLVVDGAMSVAASHDICDRIENALGKAIAGASATIHIEPDQKRKMDGIDVG